MFKVTRAFMAILSVAGISVFVQAFIDAYDAVKSIDFTDLSGKEKFKAVSTVVNVAIDEGCDEIRWWRDLTEEQRDTIINGLVELAYQIYCFVEEKKSDKIDRKRVARFRRHQMTAYNAIERARHTKEAIEEHGVAVQLSPDRLS